MAQRRDQDWLEELRGQRGYTEQAQAYYDLAAYLYKVVSRYLQHRHMCANPRFLATFAPQELAALAKDFVQETLEKLTRDDFALLDQFEGKAPFTSWVAVIASRQAAQELRRAHWNRRASLPLPQDRNDSRPIGQDEHEEWQTRFTIESENVSLEKAAMQQDVGLALSECLERLKKNQRLALLGLIVEGVSGEKLAQILNRPSRNAVFLLVRRAKKNMRKCLNKKGWDQELFEIFD